MDEPSEELAAAFFVQQAAKEKARITLPIDDWTRAVIAAAAAGREGKVKENSNDAHDAKEEVGSSHCQTSSLSTTTPTTASAWLVTTMPPAPTYRLAGNEDEEDVDGDRCGTRSKGIVGIILSSSSETQLLSTTYHVRSKGSGLLHPKTRNNALV